MQTSKYEIGANLQGLEFRRQANEILAALASSNAGNLEPASAQAGTVWLDMSNDKKHLLKIRNKANSAWGILCSIDAQSGVVDTIDAYAKKESDEKFALKDDLPPLATENKVGIVKIKNIIDAKEEDAAVTEKAVSDAIEAMKNSVAGTAKLSTNGYIKLPSGLILQWMRATSGGTQLFPITFPNECFFVSATHTALQGST